MYVEREAEPSFLAKFLYTVLSYCFLSLFSFDLFQDLLLSATNLKYKILHKSLSTLINNILAKESIKVNYYLFHDVRFDLGLKSR